MPVSHRTEVGRPATWTSPWLRGVAGPEEPLGSPYAMTAHVMVRWIDGGHEVLLVHSSWASPSAQEPGAAPAPSKRCYWRCSAQFSAMTACLRACLEVQAGIFPPPWAAIAHPPPEIAASARLCWTRLSGQQRKARLHPGAARERRRLVERCLLERSTCVRRTGRPHQHAVHSRRSLD